MQKTANILFYIALAAELFFMVLDRSSLDELPFISHVFRITFAIALLAVLFMKHSKKEWAVIAAIWIFTFISYRLSGKNDLLRYATFAMAARDADIKKVMKYSLYFIALGFGIIAFLAVIGAYGDMYVVADFGRGSVEKRYTLGFGHPNTFSGCVYALLLIWIWVYGKRAKLISFFLWLAASCVIFGLTATRTIFALFILTVALAAIIRYFPRLTELKIGYILSSAVVLVCVSFSVLAAKISQQYWHVDHETHWIYRLDRFLNGRIANLYWNTNAHAGAIESWHLFSNGMSDEFFDMGWVRLFYWYGVIPAIVVIALVLYVIYICYRKRDAYMAVIIVSLSIYTVIEATFVSRYIGRNVFIAVVGAYIGDILLRRKEEVND